MRTFFTVTLFLLTAACGASLEPGFTECGSSTCSPGQYCMGAGICQNGCTSDLNCLDGQICVDVDSVTGEGICDVPSGGEDSDQPSDTGSPSDPLSECRAACDAFGTCGLPAAEVARCRTDCGGLTADQQTSIGACGERSTCGEKMSCLGIQCFSDSDCDEGMMCNDGTCF